MIKKHGSIYWLDIWVGKKRVRRSLKTDEYSLGIERARDITLDIKRGRSGGITPRTVRPKVSGLGKGYRGRVPERTLPGAGDLGLV